MTICLGRVLLTVVALAALAYPVVDWLRAPMDDAARAELTRSGKADRFVKLGDGVMHVRVQGPADGPVVLLVHGASTGGFAFQRWIKPLADAGFRVIVPDLFGFGFSDRPAATHDKAFLVKELNDLLQALDVTGPIQIVGTSMGGAIVTDFVADNPARIRSVTLIAPAGLGRLKATQSLTVRLLLSPVIGDWLVRVWGAQTLINGVLAQGGGEAAGVEGIAEWMNRQASYRGFAEAQLDIFRNYDLQNRLEAYDAVGRSGLPVMAIWGTTDTTVPFALSKILTNRVPQTRLVSVEGQPHGLPIRKPQEMVAIVLPYLQEHAGK